MTKKDLKSGMIAVLRSGDRYLVLTNCDTKIYGKQDFCLIRKSDFLTGDRYNDDLINNYDNDKDYDIVKIYNSDVCGITYEMVLNNLIWERENVKEMTVSEIEEKLGYPIKIVK